jgi:hypothetical protein
MADGKGQQPQELVQSWLGLFASINPVGEGSKATAIRIDIASHKPPRRKPSQHVPDPLHFHMPPHALLRD